MAQPPSYERQKNFDDDLGNETDHSALNAELDRASNSINDIRTNLAILQADDGKLRPSVVTADSISDELRVSLVEGVVMDAKAMLDESKAASEASAISAVKAKESEVASVAGASASAGSADRAAAIADSVQSRADGIVETASAKAEAFAAAASESAAEAALQAEAATTSVHRTEELVDEAKLHAEVANQRGIPVGTVVSVSGAMPAGYLLADGSVVGRKTYPELFAAIGTAFGEGDGETTFNLPDLDRDIGAIVPFAGKRIPDDFLLCDGREVSREGYGDLFAVIGTTYGAGDGSTTFNLPDFIGRFAEGSAIPGTVREAGLPDAGGFMGVRTTNTTTAPQPTGIFYKDGVVRTLGQFSGDYADVNGISALLSKSNPIYGASDTVQPPALTVCYGIKARNRLASAIKAFDAAVDPGLVDLTELANDVQRNRTPVGTVAWFAMSAPPPGYLIADGSAVGRETYRKLFGAIGTTYGEGDGSTTFNLPNLIGRFAEGSATAGTVKEAGLPDIVGEVTNIASGGITQSNCNGAFTIPARAQQGLQMGSTLTQTFQFKLKASDCHPVYGAADTVQPPALTLLPCIKAFDAVVDPGLVDVSALAQEVATLAQEMAGKANKTDIVIDSHPIGSIYIQYANQPVPADLFGGIWENISALYAGMFFRAEGSNAAAFGQIQGDGAPPLWGELFIWKAGENITHKSGAFNISGTRAAENSVHTGAAAQSELLINFTAAQCDARYSLPEVRPANSTVRIWKRTA